jgi:hypothetical protein
MNMLRRICALCLSFVIASALAACNEPAVMYDMAALDRLYIPALMLTAEPDSSGKAVMAIKELKLEFMIFKSRNADDAGWDEALGRVEDMIMKADLNVNAADYKAAHAALEGIGHEMYVLRKDIGMKDYILDRMTEFHDVMDEISKTVGDKSVETLSEKDIAGISKALPRAQERWIAVVSSPFNPDVFQFTKGKTERLKGQFEKQRAALLSLESAVGRHDKESIIRGAGEMKKEYANTLRLFGNFGAASLGPS